ncbi:ATP-binding domain-containing protein [uncultured Pseudoxanthomonas sp.]|uniref:DEAD/DEAH box helicase n=1 Tax=uncultured Pseudoxanthomonas sp. TaxID=281701 RepID=UPI0026196765|nr:ATP-binding domain-containing protein [uncultured Pseudoxanthomonas sp.]
MPDKTFEDSSGMERNYRKQQFPAHSVAYSLLTYIERNSTEYGLDEAIVYSGFPLYREEDEVVAADMLIVSKNHGVLLIVPIEHRSLADIESIEADLEKAERATTLVFSRLIKSKALQRSRRELTFPLRLALFAEGKFPADFEPKDVDLLEGEDDLQKYFEDGGENLSRAEFGEISSVIEGAKGLLRPRERNTKDKPATSKVVLVANLEAEIRRFDKDQKHGYLAPLNGPQRIRGLAGSGKTVVLAMKAALTHLRNPDAVIAYTFYTKSLYQHVKRLITRFYRQFDDRDPDWEKLQVLHAWGGQTNPGVYFNACRMLGVAPLTYGAASAQSKEAFDFACKDLLSTGRVVPVWDYIFVDEGQDFSPSFMRLCLGLAKEQRIVLAYDELQTIFQVETPSAATIFGADETGNALAHFQEDVVLHKCYRNPLEVLVCAHSIGLGLYGNKVVQLPESEDHWVDLGYELKSGELREGSKVEIVRPQRNSPSSISEVVPKNEIVIAKRFDDIEDEVSWVSGQIVNDIKVDGLSPEDILVISADDRNSKVYYSILAKMLSRHGVEMNNMQSDNFALRDFTESGKITFSTVYKAKGNEGFVVYIVGVDGVFFIRSIRNRNIAFTAMTRAKGWLRVTGMGVAAQVFVDEIAASLANSPSLKFTYPGPSELMVMRRDLLDGKVSDVERSLGELEISMSPEEYEEFLLRKLKEINSLRAAKGKKAKKGLA